MRNDQPPNGFLRIRFLQKLNGVGQFALRPVRDCQVVAENSRAAETKRTFQATERVGWRDALPETKRTS